MLIRSAANHRTAAAAGRQAVALIAIAAAAAVPAQAELDARALAMGGAQTAAARGVAAAAWNPAGLAFSPGVSLRLVNATLDVHNNSFTLGRYNEVSGAALSQTDKERLLADIPDGGLRLDAGVGAGALGLQWGRLAVTTGLTACGRGNVDRDVFDLVLFGNQPGQTVDFSDTDGEGFAVGRLSASWGQPLLSGSAGRLAAGLTVSYLVGLYAVQVEEAHGSIATGATEISGEAFLSAITAEGGRGYGVDLGAAWQAPGGWTLGLAVDNALSHLAWNGTVERTQYRLTASEINLLNEDLNDALVDADSTVAVAGYSSSLPAALRLGVARDTGRLLYAADYVQGLRDRAGPGTTPRLNLGAEWRPLGWLAPRAGLSLGGTVGTGLAGGLGLQIAFWQVDLAVISRGGFGGSNTRGVGVGFSSQLVF